MAYEDLKRILSSPEDEERIYRWIFVIIPTIGLTYCTFFNNTKTREFITLVTPIQKVCQTDSGCPVVPEGWQEITCAEDRANIEPRFLGKKYCATYWSNNTSLGYNHYETDTNKFYTTRRYYSDSILTAKGGKGYPLSVRRHIRGEVKEVYKEELK